MLAKVSRMISALALPDWEALAGSMAEEMEAAAARELEERFEEYLVLEAFAAGISGDSGFGPVPAAIEKLQQRTPVASRLRTAEWQQVPLALRERAQFSAGVESVRVLGDIQDKLLARVSHQREILATGKEAFVSRDSFIRDIRQVVLDEGLDTGAGDVLTNIGAPRRLGMIYDMQNDQAAGYARWQLDNDPDALAVLPAWRLGPSSARVPRGDQAWFGRWREAGAAVGFGGASQSQMVALKTSPIWMRLSRFGSPWPPFDFGSTRELVDVWRDEAEALGLVQPDQVLEATAGRDFNEALEASVAGWSGDQLSLIRELLGDRVAIDAGRLVWRALS